MWLWKAKRTSTATGIRTRVSAMRGRRPSPLDDSGAQSDCTRLAKGHPTAGFADRRDSSGASKLVLRASPDGALSSHFKSGRMWRNW